MYGELLKSRGLCSVRIECTEYYDLVTSDIHSGGARSVSESLVRFRWV
jgi:hypothetical protein